MKIDLYDSTGKKSKQITLNSDIFGIEPNMSLMHRLLVLQRANARINLATTLTKGEVKGGGRKPFRQKGTGRARQGSIRNPHYIGGGVAHGPRGNRNFTKQMTKKSRRIALFSYLSSIAKKENIIGLESYNGKPKTKEFFALLKKLPVESSVLFVLGEKNKDIYLSTNNIPGVKVILGQYLNPVDLTTHKKLCFVGDALEKLDTVFLSKENE